MRVHCELVIFGWAAQICVETLARVEAGCYLDLQLSGDAARASDSPRLWPSPNDGSQKRGVSAAMKIDAEAIFRREFSNHKWCRRNRHPEQIARYPLRKNHPTLPIWNREVFALQLPEIASAGYMATSLWCTVWRLFQLHPHLPVPTLVLQGKPQATSAPNPWAHSEHHRLHRRCFLPANG